MKAIAQTTGRSLQHIKADVGKKGDLGIVAETSRGTQRIMFQVIICWLSSLPCLIQIPFAFSPKYICFQTSDRDFFQNSKNGPMSFAKDKLVLFNMMNLAKTKA
jgi:hypothetical protein